MTCGELTFKMNGSFTTVGRNAVFRTEAPLSTNLKRQKTSSDSSMPSESPVESIDETVVNDVFEISISRPNSEDSTVVDQLTRMQIQRQSGEFPRPRIPSKRIILNQIAESPGYLSRQNSIASDLQQLRESHRTASTESDDDASSMHVYPATIQQIADLCAQAGLEIVLYGAAALWIEGNPRPNTQVRIKDLDFGVRCGNNDVSTLKLILENVVRMSFASAVIDFGNEGKVYVTQAGTMEFMSDRETIQVSFNLQSDSDFEFTKSRSRPFQILSDESAPVSVAGLDYISARLTVPGGLIEERLFRFDKRVATLLYAVMAIADDYNRLQDVRECLLRVAVNIDRQKMKANLQRLTKPHGGVPSTYSVDDSPLALIDRLVPKKRIG